VAKVYLSKSIISVGLFCALLVIEISVVGNAFSFHTGLPRYSVFFGISCLIFLINYPFQLKIFRRSYVVLCILVLTGLASDFLFSSAHKLYMVKIIILISLVYLCFNDGEYLRRSIGRTFLHLSNIGLLLGLSAILLPEVLVFEADYVNVLRRQGDGYENTFYWSRNFSGLFLIGDEPNPLAILEQIPRYGGYYNEPAVNTFILCFSIALLLGSNYKFSKTVILLTAINFLLSFSIAGFSCIAILLFTNSILRRKSNVRIINIGRFIGFTLIIGLASPIFINSEYLLMKLGGSLDGSIALWRGITESGFLNTSSFNARVGDFNEANINIVSTFIWVSVLIYIGVKFCIDLVLTWLVKSSVGVKRSDAASNLWIVVVIIFSFKSINHYLFIPIVFVIMAQMMFVNRRRYLENLQ